MSSHEIELIAVEHEHKLALQLGTQQLQALLKLAIPEGWPQFPEAFVPDSQEPKAPSVWSGYFFIAPAEQALVGNGGFVGPPDAAGEVEIGYEIAPPFQNRGFASAAAKALLAIAFSRAEVRAVVAHTLAEENASNAVLKKIGMTFVAELPNPEVGAVWRWRKSRSL